MAEIASGLIGWERTARAIEKVKDRLSRALSALSAAGVPYAFIGENAVAEWVGRVDETAVRNTRDVDVRRGVIARSQLAGLLYGRRVSAESAI
jgi:hypothetical protein